MDLISVSKLVICLELFELTSLNVSICNNSIPSAARYIFVVVLCKYRSYQSSNLNKSTWLEALVRKLTLQPNSQTWFHYLNPF